MKKVRFESPVGGDNDGSTMEITECQSPRPFFRRTVDVNHTNLCYNYQPTNYTDPIQCYEFSNSSPYPILNKLSWEKVEEVNPKYEPSKDLELSFFDSANTESSTNLFKDPIPNRTEQHNLEPIVNKPLTPNISNSIEVSKQTSNPNSLTDNGFFMRPETSGESNHLLNRMTKKPINKLAMLTNSNGFQYDSNVVKPHSFNDIHTGINLNTVEACICHHCNVKNKENSSPQYVCNSHIANMKSALDYYPRVCECAGHYQWRVPIMQTTCKPQCACIVPLPKETCYSSGDSNISNCAEVKKTQPKLSQNSTNRKTLAIEEYENNKKKAECVQIEKPIDMVKEKRDPTVADLFNIIKLQNEQLQLLQEKVDKFITNANTCGQNNIEAVPVQNFRTEQVAVETLDENCHKISIGVMTSFEMVRASTFINAKNQNAQIQCNTSQTNLKNITSKLDFVTQKNFLEGINPIEKYIIDKSTTSVPHSKDIDNIDQHRQNIDDNEDKTVNELSLCNLHIDNATTPVFSPDQSLYLDIKDYSDSDDDNANVGWTYYNKVMTHVNGVLQDSDMPSSASALYRNTGRCVQMQIDKTNVSITKRVKFGDEPLRLQQPRLFVPPSTDTSMKMNQLAAKYLNTNPPTQMLMSHMPKQYPGVDMSLATKNYMEKHQLLHGVPMMSNLPQVEIPRFLDITALKQQPKLL